MERRKKVVLLGPVYPYKGGISHYTALMYRALQSVYDVIMVSYKLQYPKFLFKKKQKDYSNDSFRISETLYWINTINPLNWLQSAARINRQRPDFIICQWWHPYFAPCYYVLSKLLHQYKWLFVCHNVFPHERFPMDRFLTRKTLQQGNYFIVQSGQDAKDLCSVIKNPIFEQTVHPTYNAFKLSDLSMSEARKRLMLHPAEKVLLFFGFVREYKGLKHLIHALPRVGEELDSVKLLIVGDFGEDKDNYLELIQRTKTEELIEIHDGYIPDHEVEKFFAACDVVVLPYESATQSGIVQIAYGFDKPVIVTAVGGLPDVVTDGKTGYVVEPRNPDKLAEKIIKFFRENKAVEFTEHVKQEAERFSWDRLTEAVDRLVHCND